jgi:predicted PP-loop superfamily ATPase
MQKRLMATVVFSGDLDPDPAAAAAALRKAGYEVVTMTEKLRSRLDHPRDDFMEVTKRIVGDEVKQAIDAMMDDVEAIVLRYGAMCDECGQIDEDHVPFSMHR